jgi:hypothetical protein
MVLDVGVTQTQRHRIEPEYVLNKRAKRNGLPVAMQSEMKADEIGSP